MTTAFLASRGASLWSDTISEQKRKLILQLIFSNTESNDDREKWLSELETTSESDAGELIESLSKHAF